MTDKNICESYDWATLALLDTGRSCLAHPVSKHHLCILRFILFPFFLMECRNCIVHAPLDTGLWFEALIEEGITCGSIQAARPGSRTSSRTSLRSSRTRLVWLTRTVPTSNTLSRREKIRRISLLHPESDYWFLFMLSVIGLSRTRSWTGLRSGSRTRSGLLDTASLVALSFSSSPHQLFRCPINQYVTQFISV
jgi:hypothetical protein